MFIIIILICMEAFQREAAKTYIITVYYISEHLVSLLQIMEKKCLPCLWLNSSHKMNTLPPPHSPAYN